MQINVTSHDQRGGITAAYAVHQDTAKRVPKEGNLWEKVGIAFSIIASIATINGIFFI